jgi:diguanylate cyclase (GGDEF)-like protein
MSGITISTATGGNERTKWPPTATGISARGSVRPLRPRPLPLEMRCQAVPAPKAGGYAEILNRAGMVDAAERALAASQNDNSRVAILYIDLDQLKPVSDYLGPSLADELATLAVARLRACHSQCTALARFSGMEFVAMLQGVDTRTALLVAERFKSLFEQVFEVDHRRLRLEVGVGIAIGSQSDTAENLILKADLARRSTRSSGCGQLALFDDRMLRGALEHSELERDMHQALIANKFTASFQPQIDLQTDRLRAFEVLARWMHPRQGWIAPARFIPMAESSGLIDSLGWTMLNLACQQHQLWRSQCPVVPRIAVNMSPVQLRDPHLVNDIEWILASHNMRPADLEIEVTEGVLVTSEAQMLATLTRLRSLGVGIALDDFGTGHSSLSYLQHLPVTCIKLDRSLVRDVEHPRGEVIIKAMINLAHELGISVVAEGIETEDQRSLLHHLGADFGQGFLLSKPLAATSANAWLAERMSLVP